MTTLEAGQPGGRCYTSTCPTEVSFHSRGNNYYVHMTGRVWRGEERWQILFREFIQGPKVLLHVFVSSMAMSFWGKRQPREIRYPCPAATVPCMLVVSSAEGPFQGQEISYSLSDGKLHLDGEDYAVARPTWPQKALCFPLQQTAHSQLQSLTETLFSVKFSSIEVYRRPQESDRSAYLRLFECGRL